MTGKVRTLNSLREVKASAWDALAIPSDRSYNPFVSYAFLSSLEDSGSATLKTGWKPHHVVIDDGGKPVAVAPCYLKTHSYGEYVFDHGWADAFHRAGGRYYPKMQVSVPFTPASGPRLLASTVELRRNLAQALKSECSSANASSVHVTFAEDEDVSVLLAEGWLSREDIQFHWSNHGYQRFDDFLNQLSSAKRKSIRRERAAFAPLGITFEWQSGADLTEEHWDRFFAFYMETGSRKWGSPYLTREFFSLISERMPDDVLLVMAKRNGKYIAGALNFIGGDTLYGRNWGCLEQHPFLHFEVCYYQAIDFCIARKLTRVEAGAQGEHKLSRGYLPVKTRSMHYLRHSGLADAVARYLVSERHAVTNDQAILAEHSPFRDMGEHNDGL